MLRLLVISAAEVFVGAWLLMIIIGWLSSFVGGLTAIGYWQSMLVVAIAWFLGGFIARLRKDLV